MIFDLPNCFVDVVPLGNVTVHELSGLLLIQSIWIVLAS